MMTANSWIKEVQAYAILVNCHSNETTYLYLPETQIGRNPECSVITVRDINVSRLHCTFKKTTNNTCMFINRGLNGSYVNRKYCGPNDCVMLKDGDIIELVELQKYKFNYVTDSNSITINSEPMDLSVRSIYNLDSSDVFQYKDRSILGEIQKSRANLSQEETNKWTNSIKEISQLENDSEIIKNKRRKLKRKYETTDTEQLIKELQELKNQLHASNTKCQELTNKFEEANLKLEVANLELGEANLKLEILDSQRKLEKEEDYDIWSNLKCAVCLEFFIDVVMIEKCKHNFCKSCLENWRKQKKMGCPICRSRINKYFPNPLINNLVVDYINKKMDDPEREERNKTVEMRKIGSSTTTTSNGNVSSVILPSNSSYQNYLQEHNVLMHNMLMQTSRNDTRPISTAVRMQAEEEDLIQRVIPQLLQEIDLTQIAAIPPIVQEIDLTQRAVNPPNIQSVDLTPTAVHEPVVQEIDLTQRAVNPPIVQEIDLTEIIPFRGFPRSEVVDLTFH